MLIEFRVLTGTSVTNYAFCAAVVISTWQWEARLLHFKHVYCNCYRLYLSYFHRIKTEKKNP